MNTASLFLLSLSFSGALSAQVTVTIEASKDNCLFQSTTGATSSGRGNLFSGVTRTGVRLRALVAFDVARAIPKGATILSATLNMRADRSGSLSNASTTLNRVTADWGEGTSVATRGSGARATTNDATWIHTFFSSKRWKTAGGDFVAGASVTANVAGPGNYSFSSSTMTKDVQLWLDKPAESFGWIIRTNESGSQNAKRWVNRENGTAANRPRLTIRYTPPKATATAIGTGCNGGGQTAYTLATSGGLPTVPNANFGLAVTGGPTASVHAFAAGPVLPQPLPVGGGCLLRINPVQVIFANSRTLKNAIPNTTSLIGFEIATQAATTGTNGGLVTSNALALRLGL